MCGRITSHETAEESARALAATIDPEVVWTPSYNVAPTQTVLVVGRRDGARALRTLRWGLVPSWARDREVATRCILARAETLEERASFKEAFAKRRCVVAVTGWYEWKAEGGAKRPWWFHGADGRRVVALAGLWERWRDPATGEELRTCAVVTCAPNAVAAAVHDRMPVVLADEDVAAWLATETPAARLRGLLRACPDASIEAHEVDRRVGNVRANDAGLIAPLPARAA